MDFEKASYRAFELFNKDWALVTVGGMGDYNTMTVGWGEMGTLWNHRPVVSVFIHPSRYTSEFVRRYDTFTVSFYDEGHRGALAYLGSHSGRDGDKVAAAGLTPVAMGDGVTFEEAELTFLCRRIYIGKLGKEGLAQEVRDYYAAGATTYPNVTPDGTDDAWETHYAVVGEVVAAKGRVPE